METSVKSGDYEIVSTGEFSTFDEKPAIITLTKNKESFNIKLIFTKDSTTGLNIKYDGSTDKENNSVNLNIELINFTSPLPIGLTNPLEIGFFDNGDRLYLQLNVRNIGNNLGRYHVNYTLYLKEKDK